MHTRYTVLLLVAAVAIAITSVPGNSQTLYRVESGSNQTLHSVLFVSDYEGLAAGDSGTIFFTSDSGHTWQTASQPFKGNLNTIYYNDSANGAFAGDSGTVLVELKGKPPVRVTLPESNPIYGMTFPSYDTGVVCGAKGLFYMTTDSGKSWKKKSLPLAAQKFDYHGTDYFDDDTYWLVGQSGLVLYTEDAGTTWQRITVPTTKNLYSIIFPDSSGTGWIVGDQTLLLTIDGGDTWASIDTTDSLRFVSGWDSTHAYAVGLHGAILYTSNRSNWYSLASGTTANLYGFAFPDSLFFVGDNGSILTTMLPPQPNFEVIGPNSSNTVLFGAILDGVDSTNSNAIIKNLTSVPVTITSVQSDSSEFIIDNVNTPFTIDSGSSYPIEITFKPPFSSSIQTYRSSLRVNSDGAGEHFVTLVGDGLPLPASVSDAANPGQQNILLTCGARNTFITCPNNCTGPVRIEVFNVLGLSVFSSDRISDVGPNEMPGQLPAGVYFYRLSGSSGPSSGKFVLY
jgi:photosystem II stability/assembly factor-like uncharacterized protein